MKRTTAVSIIALFTFLFSLNANADVITNGFTFAVATSDDQTTGTHFHSSTGGDYGNPAGLAEVGNYSIEEVRGLSEYDLTGLGTAASAFVTFDVYGTGLFTSVNDFAFDGDIDVVAYMGNNAEDISDYSALQTAYVGSFSTVGISIGDIFSFDILSIFNDAIDNGWTSLGIRLQTEDTVNGGGAWVFNDFRLTTDNQTSSDVPEPGTLLLLGGGLAAVFLRQRKTQSI